jgi:TolB-like protein/Flp pilus assembly protein TadD
LKTFFRELRRRRVFRTAALYIVGAWLVLQVADVLFPGWGLPDAAINILLIAVVVGFPLALVFGWFYDVTTHGIVRTPAVGEHEAGTAIPLQRTDYLILAALAGIAFFIVFQAGTEIAETPRVEVDDATEKLIDDAPPLEKLPNSIAVLPFANVSDDPSNEFFCDGISDELLHKLTGFGDLHVIGRTSSFAFKGSDYRIPRIASLLGVRYLLQGSVRKHQDQLRITAQLVDDAGTQLWSSAFDRRLEDIFAIQAEIADIVATTVVPQIVPDHAETYEPDLAAYQHYLIGREYVHERMVPQAREELAKAVELDPDFAEAQAEYAVSMIMWRGPEDEELSIAEQAIDRALALAPGLPRALAARGLLLLTRSDPEGAEELLRQVLAEDPNMVDAINWLISALTGQGKVDETMEWYQRALRIDPMHPAIAVNLADLYLDKGQVPKAETILLRLGELPEPNGMVLWHLIRLYRVTGRFPQMLKHAERLALEPVFFGPFRAYRYGVLAQSYALLSDWEQVEHWAEQGLTPAPKKGSFERSFWIRLYSEPDLWRGRYMEALENHRGIMAAEGLPPEEMEPYYGVILALAGDHAAAQEVLAPVEITPDDFGDPGKVAAGQTLAWSYSVTDQKAEARPLLEEMDRWMAEMQSNGLWRRSDHLYVYALNATLLEQRDVALERLRRAVDAGWRDYYVHSHDPRWDALKDNAGYQALMADVKADVERQRAEIQAQQTEQSASE